MGWETEQGDEYLKVWIKFRAMIHLKVLSGMGEGSSLSQEGWKGRGARCLLFVP